MIVANMNLHEVYADLIGEMGKLDWKRDALLNKAVNILRRSEEFPASVMYDYQIQTSKNQYIIYFYREHPFAPVLSGYLCVLFDGSKRYIIKVANKREESQACMNSSEREQPRPEVKWTDKGIPEILILTSHFLQRYKERFLKQPELSANVVAVRFLSRNRTLRIIPVDERINKRIEEYGEFAGEGFLAQDGFCFKLSGEETISGDDPVRISFFTTFMPLSEMSDVQREAIFEECMKDLEYLDR